MSTQTTQQIKATTLFQKTSFDTWRNTVDFLIEATEKSMKFFDESANGLAQFNTNQIESWFATFKKAKN